MAPIGYNVPMDRPDRSQKVAVKRWSFAGLLWTYRCNARCSCCYLGCSPRAGGDMSIAAGLELWRGLVEANPAGCRVHIGGGEPFLRWPELIELCRQARAEGLGPLEAVETNAFWATDPAVIDDRLAQLDAAGMGRLDISCDPYHQQYVPIANVRRLAWAAEDRLGSARVKVRWRDWLADGFDTAALPETQRKELFANYLTKGHERLLGRAAEELAALKPLMPLSAFADIRCNESLLRSRHVHVDGQGHVCPGVCAGIVLGVADTAASVGRLWQTLTQGFAGMEVIGVLASGGPAALAAQAAAMGYPLRDGYAGKCHLCWDVRSWLRCHGHCPSHLGPAGVYEG